MNIGELARVTLLGRQKGEIHTHTRGHHRRPRRVRPAGTLSPSPATMDAYGCMGVGAVFGLAPSIYMLLLTMWRRYFPRKDIQKKDNEPSGHLGVTLVELNKVLVAAGLGIVLFSRGEAETETQCRDKGRHRDRDKNRDRDRDRDRDRH